MTQLLETVVGFFEENDWHYVRRREEPVLQIAFRGDAGEWPCYVFANEERQRLAFYSVCPVRAAEDRRMAVAEFITRVNYGLVIGNFELDFDDGEVRLKTSIDVQGDRLTTTLLQQMVLTNVALMDLCLPVIMEVIHNDVSPAHAMAGIEGT